MKISGFKFICFLTVSVILVLIFSGSTLKTIISLKEEADYFVKELNDLKNQNIKLSNEIKWIASNGEYVKYLAKKNLGLLEPGEVKFYIVEESDNNKSVMNQTAVSSRLDN